MIKKLLFQLSCLLFFSLIIFSQTQKTVTAHRTATPIKIDGELNEPVWKEIPVGNFTQRQPKEGLPSSENSFVWVAYDDANIYVAARLDDKNPEQIDASVTRQDTDINSDWFAVFIDPYNDKQTGYYFAVNAGSSKLDGTLYNDSWDDSAWDGIWTAKSKVGKSGWSTEIQIPLSQLKFNQSDKMVWGINFRRDIKRNNEQTFYIMVPKEETGFVSKFASLTGLDDLKSSNSVDVFPYFVQKAKYFQHDLQDPFYKSGQYPTALGADFKYSLTSNFTLNGTINPDFGQVEVDPAVINLSAFETYFDEKRPFFTESSNFFNFGFGGINNSWGFNFGVPDIFYSRRIGRYPQGDLPDDFDYTNAPKETRILGAAKVTGRIGNGWSVGIMDAVTERTFAKTTYNNENSTLEVEPLTNYTLIRGLKEFDNGKHGAGFIFTGVNRDLRNGALKENLTNSAYTLGFDGWTTIDKEGFYVMNASVVGSRASGSQEAMINVQEKSYRYFQRPDATYMPLDSNKTSLNGWYARTMINKQKGSFYLNAALGALSPGFEYNDMGYQWGADRINGHLVLGYRWYKPDGIFREKGFYVAHARNFDFEGDPTNNTIYGYVYLNTEAYYDLQIRGSINFEDYNYSLTRGGPKVRDPQSYWIYGYFHTDERKEFVFSLESEYSHNQIGGKYFGVYSGLEWQPLPSVRVSFGPQYSVDFATRQWVDNFEDPTAVNTFFTRYVFADLNQKTISGNIRVNWAFSPQLTLELFVQPLFSVGNYRHFKELAESRSKKFRYYEDGTATVSFNGEDNVYKIDPDGSGPAEVFEFDNPDFNFKSLRANLVLRWEIRSGSVFYFVWTQEKTDDHDPGNMNFRKDFTSLLKDQPDNIFLIKYSHWFSI